MPKKIFILFAIVEFASLAITAACNVVSTIQAKTHAKIVGYEAGRAIVIEGEKNKEAKKKPKQVKAN